MYVRQNKSQLGIATNRGFEGTRLSRRNLGQAAPQVEAPLVPVPVAAPVPETTVVKDGGKVILGCIAVWLLLKLVGYV